MRKNVDLYYAIRPASLRSRPILAIFLGNFQAVFLNYVSFEIRNKNINFLKKLNFFALLN